MRIPVTSRDHSVFSSEEETERSTASFVASYWQGMSPLSRIPSSSMLLSTHILLGLCLQRHSPDQARLSLR